MASSPKPNPPLYTLPITAFKRYIASLRKRWQFSNFDIAVVFSVFSVAGMVSLQIRPYVVQFLPHDQQGLLAQAFSYIMFLFIYYFVLLFIGTLVGKRGFFFWMFARPFRRIFKLVQFLQKAIRAIAKPLATIIFRGKI